MGRFFGFIGLVALGVLGAAGSLPAPAQSQQALRAPLPVGQLHALQGRWQLINRAAAVEARNAAVLRATEEMGPLIRFIARRRLRSGTPIHQAIELQVDGRSVHAKVGPYDVALKADGSQHPFTDPLVGEAMRASQTLRGDTLRQTFVGADATVFHTLRPRAGGRQLSLTVRIASRHLPADLRFDVRYRRVDG